MFPAIISKVPTRDYGIEGLEVHADNTSTGTVYQKCGVKAPCFSYGDETPQKILAFNFV